MTKSERMKEYLSAAATAALVSEELVEASSWEEFEWVTDTLVELLERYNDVAKPKAEAEARSRD